MNNKITKLKVLNIAQPNAYHVMHSGKNIENRSMVSYFRGTIAIYASATYDKSRFEDSEVKRDECNFGCIIGFVDIVDCIVEQEVTESTKDWFHGPYGYVFENVRVLKKPVSVKPPKGAIVWWNLEGGSVMDCIDQIDLSSYLPVEKIKPDSKRPKPKGGNRRGKLTPSATLAEIIGSEPIFVKKAIVKFLEYLSENDLIGYCDNEEDDEQYIFSNEKVKNLFKKDVITFEECGDIIRANMAKEENYE